HEEIVPDQLHSGAEEVGGEAPAVPVVLGDRILEGDDRIAAYELVEQVEQVARGERAALRTQSVGARLAVVELARRDVAGEGDVAPGDEACRLDRLDHQGE